METATFDGVELEYEVTGSGEPVLLISPVLADGFLPLVSEPSLEGYQLIRYHKRGWVGSTHTEGPVTVEDHAADAAALLDHLGIARAHVAGHSSGAAVAAQLALDEPGRVATLILLELSLFSVPSGEAFLEAAAPVFDAYGRGEHEEALGMFLSAVSGLDRAACQQLLAERIPGAAEQALKDVDTFFGVELPGLSRVDVRTRAGRRHRVPGPVGPRERHAAAVGRGRGVPALVGPRRRGVHDRRRRPPPAHPAPRARRASHRGLPRTPRHRRSMTPRPPAIQPTKEIPMPLIQVKLIEGVFDASEKETIIEKLTDAMVSVEGEAMRPVTWVTIEEVTSGEWGIGGKALHTGDVVGMRAAASSRRRSRRSRCFRAASRHSGVDATFTPVVARASAPAVARGHLAEHTLEVGDAVGRSGDVGPPSHLAGGPFEPLVDGGEHVLLELDDQREQVGSVGVAVAGLRKPPRAP